MSYPFHLALSASLLLSGCTSVSPAIKKPTTDSTKKSIKKTVNESVNTPITQPVIQQKVEPQEETFIQIDTPPTNTIVKDEFNDYELTITHDENNLEGKYILERGQISFAGVRKDITDSKLVIEKLGVNDLGYYYTVKVKGYPRNEYFGIFSKQDGKYVQKIISDDGEVSYYDNIELIHEDQRIKLTIKTNQEKRIIIWKKVDFIENAEELKSAKEIYTQVCKANYCEEI